MPSTAYALRIDGEHNSALSAIVQQYGLKGFGVRENANGNVHCHYLLMSDEGLKMPALRKTLLQKMPELRGNGSYSIASVKDLQKYCRYMAKGESAGVGPTVVWQETLFSIDELHNEYWIENAARYRPTLPLPDFVVQKARDENVEYTNRSKLAEIWVREAVARKKPLNVFQIRSQLNLIQCMLCPTDQQILNIAGEI